MFGSQHSQPDGGRLPSSTRDCPIGLQRSKASGTATVTRPSRSLIKASMETGEMDESVLRDYSLMGDFEQQAGPDPPLAPPQSPAWWTRSR